MQVAVTHPPSGTLGSIPRHSTNEYKAMMKKFTDLTFEQQEQLRKNLHEYQVQSDPVTLKSYVRFMGESVEYRSITANSILLG